MIKDAALRQKGTDWGEERERVLSKAAGGVDYSSYEARHPARRLYRAPRLASCKILQAALELLSSPLRFMNLVE